MQMADALAFGAGAWAVAVLGVRRPRQEVTATLAKSGPGLGSSAPGCFLEGPFPFAGRLPTYSVARMESSTRVPPALRALQTRQQLGAA